MTMRHKFAGGVDVGSCTTKAVIVDEESRLLASRVIYSGTDFHAASLQAWEECLGSAGLSNGDVTCIVSTGYGRKSVSFAASNLTEISCHGRGCLYFFPGPITVVDIGGQDNKIIKLKRERTACQL